jgi:ADP-heptose:LPS heptosyltransferase
MASRILLIRMMGLGDVACILLPAVRHFRRQHPMAQIDVLTFGAGADLMRLDPEVRTVHALQTSDWPDDLATAVPRFLKMAEQLTLQSYDQVVNLDTWFMPCFLAQVLHELGLRVDGNRLKWSTTDFFSAWRTRRLDPAMLRFPEQYLSSNFPGVAEWHRPWWLGSRGQTDYASFYLTHVCGFPASDPVTLQHPCDANWMEQTKGRPIVALSTKGSREAKRYPHHDALQQALTHAGYYVWSQFDGSIPMKVTLGRLGASTLLITVPTSTQWLARLVNCPSLMIPGAIPPHVLGAESTIAAVTSCQYCLQTDCNQPNRYACLDVKPDLVVREAQKIMARVS